MNAVIFDIDNTLYDYDYAHSKALEKVIKYFEENFYISPRRFIELYAEHRVLIKSQLDGTAASHNKLFYFKSIIEFLGDNPINHLETLEKVYWSTFHSSIKVHTWVYDVFDFLKSKNIKIGLCTDFMLMNQIEKIRLLQLSNYIDGIVSSEEVGHDKPHSLVYEKIVKLLAVELNEVLFIGDDYHKDYLKPSEIGMKALHYKEGDGILNALRDILLNREQK